MIRGRGRLNSPLGPRGVDAERAHVSQDGVDFRPAEGVPEDRHHAVEAAHGPAFVDDGEPVGVGFAGSEGTVREVGERDGESDFRLQTAATVVSVADRTGGRVQFDVGLVVGRRLGRHGGRPQESNQPEWQNVQSSLVLCPAATSR